MKGRIPTVEEERSDWEFLNDIGGQGNLDSTMGHVKVSCSSLWTPF